MSSSAGARNVSVVVGGDCGTRKGLRSSEGANASASAVLTGAQKRKQAKPVKEANQNNRPKTQQQEKSRPRVHAQRKFAHCPSSFPVGCKQPPPSQPQPCSLGPAAKANAGSSSSSSSASGLTHSTGERPKTEDFLTFLCLRGTGLLPPELDFFNKANLDQPVITSEEESSDHEKITGAVARKTARRESLAKKEKRNGPPGKKLPASVQALKRKYTEQRLAKKVVSQTLPSSAGGRRTRSQQVEGASKRPARGARADAKRDNERQSKRTMSPGKTRRDLASRKPSAAALIARRKTRMATLTAASSRVSRMLTRLTPRGTSNAAFVKSTRKIPLASRSLRGRDISLSSEEETEVEEKKTPPKRRLKTRTPKPKGARPSESDADEETSSRDSSRRGKTESSTQFRQKKLESLTTQLKRREGRSVSRDSSASKDSSKSDGARPSRKTKEAATAYLNMLGQKLSGKKDDDDVSIESLSDIRKTKKKESESSKESTPVRKLVTPSLKKREDKAASESEKKKPKKDDTKDKKKSKNSLKQLQDMLLEEAKKNIAKTPTDTKIVTDSDTNDSEERITISQRTGYIQVKPRKSTDQADEVTVLPSSSIGQRRLSKNGEQRTSTPPRKILPKSDLIDTRRNSSSPGKSHLPAGVMASSRLGSTKANTTTTAGMQILQQQQQTTVPLTQPLVINTAFPGGGGGKQQTAPVQIATAPIILPNQGLRMPVQMGTIQIQPPNSQTTNPIPILGQAPIQLAGMQQIALPAAFNATNPITQTNAQPQFQPAVRHPYGFPGQQGQMTSAVSSSVAPPPLSSAVSMSSTTDVTTSNTQPLVSPGPPMLSPQAVEASVFNKNTAHLNQHPQSQAGPEVSFPHHQALQQGQVIGQQQQQQQQQHFVQAGYPPSMIPMQHYTNPYGFQQHAQPPLYQPVYKAQSVQPKKNDIAPSSSSSSSQSSSKPTASMLQKQQLLLQQMAHKTSGKTERSKTIFSKSPQKQPVKTSATSSSFKVENESSPYAFEADAAEPSIPYRKTSVTPKGASSKAGQSQKATPSSSAGPKPTKKKLDPGLAVQCDLENAKEMGSSIPIPKELANQLAAQAKKEGTSGNPEMTYFIPLQSSSGQSFGVAVKLGTEGPAGPNQKVIMKAKLVTQPSGKPVGARVIGTKDNVASPSTSSGRKFSRMPMASPASPSRNSDSDSDDSRPSTSTGRMGSPDSTRQRKKHHHQEREVPDCCLGSVENFERFPKLGGHAHLVEAPVYAPTEKEFKDPIKFIEKIRKEAEPFGFCRIIPPSSFKPECNVDDDMRFTAYNQVIQKMMNRWGPNTKEMAAIKKYLETQNITIKPHPVVGGVEIDFPALYHAVQSFGGLTEVIQRKRWGKIADFLRIPKGTQDRGNKLDDIYCKYLLPYDTLSNVEREELHRLVEEEFEETNKRKLDRSRNEDEQDESEEDEDYECVLKGKSTSLSQFYRVARNLMTMIFKQSEPDAREVEEEYWRLVLERDSHIQVQQGSIDTGDEGFGFPTSRASSCGRHAWNLKMLSNNPKSLLRCMGPVMGVTVPTLNVGMVFTSGCWYRDPHGLPWIEYLHSGASKVWYGVPDSHSIAFYTAMKQLVPTFCRNKKIWLPADTTMVPPNLLVKYGVSVCRTIQEPGQFLVVFPKTYTSYICSGYSLSESVYYAPRDYLSIAENEFKSIRESAEPMMFPFQKMLICIAKDEVSTKETLRMVKPFLEKIRDNEYVKRAMLSDLGVKNSERIILKTKKQEQDDEYECEICSENLYVSYMCDVKEDLYYCMEHAVEYLQEKKIAQRKHCKLLYTHSKEEISSIIKALNKRLNSDSDASSSSSDEEFQVTRAPVVRKPRPPPQPPTPTSLPSPTIQETTPVVVQKPKKKERVKKEKKQREEKKPKETSKKRAAEPAGTSSTTKRRKTKTRKAAMDKSGNLAVEILDMLLSASEGDEEDTEEEEESSDEAWK